MPLRASAADDRTRPSRGGIMNKRTGLIVASSAVLLTVGGGIGAASLSHGTPSAKGVGVSSSPRTTQTTERPTTTPAPGGPAVPGARLTTTTTAGARVMLAP